jgi:hypothetical protein
MAPPVPGGLYRAPFSLDDEDRILIWREEINASWEDGVILDTSGHGPTFSTVAALHAYAQGHELRIEEEIEEPLGKPADLDTVVRWLRNPGADTIDCVAFLAAWNLFGDVARTVGADEFDPDVDATRMVYDKIFWGNNLPPMTPVGEHYEPIWNDDEVAQIAGVLGIGLRIFREVVQDAPPLAV